MVSVEKAIWVLEGVVNFPEITLLVVFVTDERARRVFEGMVKDEFVDASGLADHFEAWAAAGDNLPKDAGLAPEG